MIDFWEFHSLDLLEHLLALLLSLDVNNLEGILVVSVLEGWAADEAGLKEGDIILSLDDQAVNTKAEFDEWVQVVALGPKVNGLVPLDTEGKSSYIIEILVSLCICIKCIFLN